MAIPCVSMMASSPLGGTWKVGGDWPPCGCPFPLLELQHISEVGAQCCLVGSIGVCGDAFWGYLGRSWNSGRLLHLLLCSHDGDSSKGSVLFGRELLKELLGDKSTVGPSLHSPWQLRREHLHLQPPLGRSFEGKNKCKRQKSARSRAYPVQYLAFSYNWQIPGVILKAQCKPWLESRAFLTAWQAHGELGTQRVGHCDCGDGWTCKFVKSWSTWLGWAVL